MSTNFVPNPSALPVTYTKILSNQPDEDFQTGRTKPPLFTCERPQSIQLVIDGKTRQQGQNPFDFRVSINNNLFRARMARVRRVVIPKPPNVTQFNNVIDFTQDDGQGGPPVHYIANIQPAFYNTTDLANAIAAAMTAVAGGLNVYVCAFDPITRTFSISYTYNGVPQFFYIENISTFVIRGEFLAPFPSHDPGLDPTVVGGTTIRSGICGMVYTRYAIVSSESFNQYSFSDSRSTTLRLKNNIICIVDMTDIYDPVDYDVGVPYAGLYASVTTPEAPHIMVTNPQRNLNERVDIFVQDEYGESFQDVMFLGPSYPPNACGVSIWLEVSF